MPASAYAAGSAQKSGFDLLNAERSRCGFGLLRQNTQLDAAAADHSRWMALNQFSSHTQDGTRFPNGFTGRTAVDRATFRGYTNGFVGEEYVYASNLPDRLVETGASRMRQLLNAPFHLSALMLPNREVGFGFVSRGSQGFTDNTRFLTPYVVLPARKFADGSADVASNQVVTYPCEGTTGVFPGLFGEEPNPLPGRDLATNPAGHGILVRTRINTALFITSSSIREVGTSTNLAIAATLTKDSPIPVITGAAVIIPDKPLKDNTSYTVTITGEANQMPFTRTFTFTTGAFFQ